MLATLSAAHHLTKTLLLTPYQATDSKTDPKSTTAASDTKDAKTAAPSSPAVTVTQRLRDLLATCMTMLDVIAFLMLGPLLLCLACLSVHCVVPPEASHVHRGHCQVQNKFSCN